METNKKLKEYGFIIEQEVSKGNTNPIKILKQLDLSEFCPEVKRNIYPQESIAKTYIYNRVNNVNYSKTVRIINNNPEIAEDLGYTKNENDEWLLPTAITLRHYKKNYEKNIIIQKIIGYFKELIIPKINKYKESKTLKEKELTRLVKTILEKEVKDKRHHNTKHDFNEILEFLDQVASLRDYINKNALYNIEHERLNTPTARETIYSIKKLGTTEEIITLFNKAIKNTVIYLKKNYKTLNRKYTICIDIHEIPYYGKRSSYAIGCKNQRGTNKAVKFLVCSIGQYPRIVLYALPINDLDIISELLDIMLSEVKHYIGIDKVLLDRGFNGSNFINAIKKHKLTYIMPQKIDTNIERYMRKAEGSPSRVFKDYKYGDSTTNLVIVEDKNGEKRLFSTNWNINENLTQYLFKYYNSKGFSARWSIENVFKTVTHDFKIKTTSTDYRMRLFNFMYANLLYNLWITVNLFLNLALYGKTRDKSLIPAKTFVRLMTIKVIDTG